METINDIIQAYDNVVKVMDNNASGQTDRAYGGLLRATKGRLQEHIQL